MVQCNADPNIGDCSSTAGVVGIHFLNGGASPFPDGGGGTCELQIITGLTFCGKVRYSCQITDGPGGPTTPGTFPTEDAFIEWFWAIEYTDSAGFTHFITGKFTFCASASHIFNTWTNNNSSYFNASGYGIPMFNPSNHNV